MTVGRASAWGEERAWMHARPKAFCNLWSRQLCPNHLPVVLTGSWAAVVLAVAFSGRGCHRFEDYQAKIRNGMCNFILKSRSPVEQSCCWGVSFSGISWFGRQSVERWEVCLAIQFPACESLWPRASSPISLSLIGLTCEMGRSLCLPYRVAVKSDATVHVRHGEQCLGHSECRLLCCSREHITAATRKALI